MDELEIFTKEVISESESEHGTWSLATYNKVNNLVSESNKKSIMKFIDTLIIEMTDKDCSPKKRYKLAQMCTTLKSKNIQYIGEEFDNKKNELMNMCKESENKALSGAITNLISILFVHTTKVHTISPPPVINTIHYPPFHITKVSSKTP